MEPQLMNVLKICRGMLGLQVSGVLNHVRTVQSPFYPTFFALQNSYVPNPNEFRYANTPNNIRWYTTYPTDIRP